jgi:hypothetical protein
MSRSALSFTASVFVIVAIIGAATAGLIIYGVEFGNTNSTLGTNCCTTQSNPNDQYFYPSDINSSVSCDYLATTNTLPGFGNLISNIESYPKFVTLEQNRIGYTYGGQGCSESGNGTQYGLSFYYVDTAHPFGVCINGTGYPEYYIDVALFLTPSGYDLSQSVFSTRYYDSTNSTYSCTIQLTPNTTTTTTFSKTG